MKVNLIDSREENLSSPLDPLPYAEVADHPGDPQGDHQLSLQAAWLVNLMFSDQETFLF